MCRVSGRLASLPYKMGEDWREEGGFETRPYREGMEEVEVGEWVSAFVLRQAQDERATALRREGMDSRLCGNRVLRSGAWVAVAGLCKGLSLQDEGEGLDFGVGGGEAGLDEALGVFPVHGGAALDDFEVLVLEGVDLAGDSDDDGFGGDVGVGEDYGACADDAVVVDLGVLEQDGVDADHDVAADAVAVEDGAVGDDDVVADDQVVVGVKDAVVLDVGVASDADASVVTA